MNSLLSSLFRQTQQHSWRLFRASGSELQSLDCALKLTGNCDPLIVEGFAGSRVELCVEENLVLVIEPEPLCPALFDVSGERFTVGFATITDNIEWLKAQGADVNFKNATLTQGIVTSLLENLWRLWEQRCRNRALECVQSEYRMDREGADFFDVIESRLKALFSPDYLEIAPLNSSVYWPDRPEGWSWIYATRPEYQWPVPLAPDFESSLLNRGSVQVFNELEDRVFSLPPSNNGVNFKSGVFIPLTYRGHGIGLIKLLFARDVVLSMSEEAALPTVMHGLSLIFDRTAQHLRTQRMAMVDGLTNLFNHRFFLSQLRTEFQRSLRYGGVMTLLMIDVDGFKNYNDTYGHQAGNRVLSWVASQIRRTVRDIDVVARYGGEEFALILPEVRAEQGLIVAEKIRKVISATEITSESGDRLAPITISCGVTDSTGCKSPEDMIDRADQALYWVKRNGRNLVRMATLE
jgi:diguanylate cyclase (GGDEF)-like protein